MSWKDILNLIWTMANSSVGITFIAAVLLFGLNKLWSKKPKWKAIYEEYEGTIISAIKEAEKMAGSSGKEKLEKALELVVGVLERTHGKAPSLKEKAALLEAINKKHDEL